MNTIRSLKQAGLFHISRHWHHHLAFFGSAAAALVLITGTAATTAIILGHGGGFTPGPMNPPIRFSGSAPLPPATSLASFITRIHNQGASNSCVGQGLSTLVEITQQEHNHRSVVVIVRHPHRKPIRHSKIIPAHDELHFSAGYIYDQVNGGQDQGTTYDAAFRVLISQGDDRLRIFPHDGPDWWVQPTPAQRKSAFPYRFISWASIAATDRATQEFELSRGRPFVVALPVHNTIYSHWYNPTPIYADSGAFHFWHVFTAIGYSPLGLRVLNSWGPGYGENGQVMLTWPFLERSQAAIAIAMP